MSPETIQSIAGVASIIVAVAALVVAIRSERRAKQQFEEQLAYQEKIAIANIKPLVSILQSKYLSLQSVKLRNDGVGTAVIKNISINKGNQAVELRMAELFKFPNHEPFAWDRYIVLRGEPIHLQTGNSVTLIEISEGNLVQQEIGREDARAIIHSFQKQTEGIMITVDYEDVLGNPQDQYKKVLHS